MERKCDCGLRGEAKHPLCKGAQGSWKWKHFKGTPLSTPQKGICQTQKGNSRKNISSKWHFDIVWVMIYIYNIRISSVIRYFSPGNNLIQWSDIVFTLVGHLIYVKNKMKNRYILDTGLKCVHKTWGFALEHDLKSSPEQNWEPSEQF